MLILFLFVCFGVQEQLIKQKETLLNKITLKIKATVCNFKKIYFLVEICSKAYVNVER